MEIFTIIDDFSESKNKFSSTNFEVTVHEYLSIIYDMLRFLVNSGIKFTAVQLKFDNLWIGKSTIVENKRYPWFLDKYTLDLVNFVLIGNNTKISLRGLSNSISYLDIVNKIQQITNKTTYPQIQTGIKKINNIVQPRIINTEDESNIIQVENPSNHPRLMNSIVTEITDPTDLEKQMELLKKKKEEENQKLEELKNVHNEKLEKFSNFTNDHGDKKRMVRADKERATEKRRIFESDKETYQKIKADIEKGKIKKEKISELFTDKYEIFSIMEEYNLLDKENEYAEYMSLYEEIYPPPPTPVKEEYIPHNINYLNEEEQAKYKKVNQENTPESQEINKTNPDQTNQKIPPLSEILESVDKDELINLKEKENEDIPIVDFE